MADHDLDASTELVTSVELEAIHGGAAPPTPEQIEIVCGDKPLELCGVWF